MKCPGLYLIRNRLTRTVYIGHSANTGQRIRQHRHRLNQGTHANPHLQAAWDKYGCDAFRFRHLVDIGDLRDRCSEETRVVAAFRAKGRNVYNVGEGGEGQPHTPESRAKISMARTGMKFSEDHCRHMAEANALRPPPSAETRELMRKAMTGRRYPERNASPEYRLTMSENRKKRKSLKQTDATKEKLRQANVGQVRSDEAKQNMRDSRAKALARGQRSHVKLISYSGLTLCIKEWADRTGIPASLLTYRLGRGGWSVEDALTTPVDTRKGAHMRKSDITHPPA